MPKITNTTFNINEPSINLTAGEKLIFKFHLDSLSGLTNNDYSATIGQGNLEIQSLSATSGYNEANSSYIDSASMADVNNVDTIVLSSNLTGFHGGGFLFIPNPPSPLVENTLYGTGIAEYGDVDFPFIIAPFDMVLVYLSDGTYIEAQIISINTVSSKLHLKLNIQLSTLLRSNLANGTFKRFLILSKREDETNAILEFIKRDGKTSYGFLIPEDINQKVLDNIDVITKEVKQKLLGEQATIGTDLNGGTFG
jgi:hypothetical protein